MHNYRPTGAISLRPAAARALPAIVLLWVLAACTTLPPEAPALPAACPVTETEWVKPPDDAAIQNPPVEGHHLVNADRSIWASAWWMEQGADPLRAGEDGNKVGWFRPAGAALALTGRRLDIPAPPMEAHVPCCYPTRFQASGLYFPTDGCWEVTARAAESELVFVVWVEP